MPEHEVDIAVIGAGVVGIACAASLSRAGKSVVVLDRHEGAGRETSSRNSGVIHAGIYYPPGSLKAELCVRGRQQLYEWCRSHDVPHERCGKWIVATNDAESEQLVRLARQANDNGAGSVALIDGARFRKAEPRLVGTLAMWSPESGILDVHALIESLRRDAEATGVVFGWKAEVRALDRSLAGWAIDTVSGHGDDYTLRADAVVNAAGLHADRVAAMAGLDVDRLGYRLRFCKGDYFALSSDAPHPVERLVYPVVPPGSPGLGIHLTRDLGGRWIAGPGTAYVDEIDYAVDESVRDAFAESIREYMPGLRSDQLSPDYAGIRPKRVVPPASFPDFVVHESSADGAPGMVQLIGIESPGLTAALAIADRVTSLLTA